MLFEKTTRHRPKAVAGAEVYFVRNLQIRRLIFAAAYMNGRFSRCAAARIFSLTRHFHRCERTQRKIRIHTLGSQPPFAALAHRKHWVAAPSVRFLQVAHFSLRAQRKSAIRP
jgi:hypothetical protein